MFLGCRFLQRRRHWLWVSLIGTAPLRTCFSVQRCTKSLKTQHCSMCRWVLVLRICDIGILCFFTPEKCKVSESVSLTIDHIYEFRSFFSLTNMQLFLSQKRTFLLCRVQKAILCVSGCVCIYLSESGLFLLVLVVINSCLHCSIKSQTVVQFLKN